MSVINLKLIVEDAQKHEVMLPDSKLCPVLSRYHLEKAPMDSEPGLVAFNVICAKELCGMWPKCSNTPSK